MRNERKMEVVLGVGTGDDDVEDDDDDDDVGVVGDSVARGKTNFATDFIRIAF